MATWTAPKTWSNAAVTAAEFNTHIRDNETWLKGAFTQLNVTSDSAKAKITPALVGCRVTKLAAQTITTALSTAIEFNTESFDSDAFHDNTTNNTRITIPAAMGGYYMIGAQIEFTANATGDRRVFIMKNGTSTLAQETQLSNGASLANRFVMSALVQLDATDYIETNVLQTSGGNLDVTTNNSPIMWIHRFSST
jgi:hypothetical protein